MNNRDELRRKIETLFATGKYKDILEEWYEYAYCEGCTTRFAFEMLRDILEQEAKK